MIIRLEDVLFGENVVGYQYGDEEVEKGRKLFNFNKCVALRTWKERASLMDPVTEAIWRDAIINNKPIKVCVSESVREPNYNDCLVYVAPRVFAYNSDDPDVTIMFQAGKAH